MNTPGGDDQCKKKEIAVERKYEEKKYFGDLGVDGKIILQGILGRTNRLLSFHYILSTRYDTDRIENTASKNYYTVACNCCSGNVFIQPLPRNDPLFWLYY
jgi:hypothetical protein